MKLNPVVVMALYFAVSTQGARILAVLPIFAKSHHRFTQPVLKTLARAGHQVVVYSPFPLEQPVPNYTDVVLDVSTDNANITANIVGFMESPAWRCVDIAFDVVDKTFQDLFENGKIQSLLSSDQHFDLVITEFFGAQEFTQVFGHVFKAPVIGLQAFFTNNVVNHVFGNYLSLSYIPDTCTAFPNRMTFYERALNAVYSLRGLYHVYYRKYLPYVDSKLRTLFPQAPPLLDIVNNVSLIFVNDHLTADYAQPRPANIIPVAGIHIEHEKPLPEPMKTFVDEATDGVILFSLGTYTPDELQPREYFDMYIRVFRQLRQRVLWKTRKENIDGLPDNVMDTKWVPQRDLLCHPKVVLFITHGGLLSQHETLHCGVPVVSIPQFYDQHRNARFYEEKGIGVRLDVHNLTEDSVMTAIRTVLDNPEYRSNAQRQSRLFRDRPMSPSDLVVYWTEYVLRHGTSHLRPVSTDMSWYQLALLDVIGAFLVVLVIALYTVYVVIHTIIAQFVNLRTNIKIKCKLL